MTLNTLLNLLLLNIYNLKNIRQERRLMSVNFSLKGYKKYIVVVYSSIGTKARRAKVGKSNIRF